MMTDDLGIFKYEDMFTTDVAVNKKRDPWLGFSF